MQKATVTYTTKLIKLALKDHWDHCIDFVYLKWYEEPLWVLQEEEEVSWDCSSDGDGGEKDNVNVVDVDPKSTNIMDVDAIIYGVVTGVIVNVKGVGTNGKEEDE